MVDSVAEAIRKRIAMASELEPLEVDYIVDKDEAPKPFIVPPIAAVEDEDSESVVGAGSSEIDVILIDARAAVGKTTFARWLASTTRAPLLDLAITPVGAQTARGILPDLSDGSETIDGRAAFRNGQITLIIDAVDEGRLRSGEANVEVFLSDLWTMLKSRTVRNRPGVVFLGRPESIDFVKLAMRVDGLDSFETYRLHFFDEESAREMVLAYAHDYASTHRTDKMASESDDWGSPVQELLNSYFTSVAEALEMDSPADLWKNEHGRQFAGYSPVLRTLGEIVGGETNHGRLAAQLDSGRSSAWAVIEAVCQTVFEREQEKLRRSLLALFPDAVVPTNAYDRREQVRAIMAHLSGVGDVRNALADIPFPDPLMKPKYRELVKSFVSEHPFCDRTDSPTNPAFSNPILGAILLAEAMIQGVDFNPNNSVFKGCGMQSFLWQALRHRWDDDRGEARIHLVSGRCFGLIADSFDAHETMAERVKAPDAVGDSPPSGDGPPLAVSSLRLRESDLGLQTAAVDDAIAVSFTEPNRAEKDFLELLDTPYLGPEVRSIEIDLPGHDVVIEGTQHLNEVRFSGWVRIRAKRIRIVNCTSMVGDSSASVELIADEVTHESHINLHNFIRSSPEELSVSDENHPARSDSQARLYTFGSMTTQYPWSDFSGPSQGRDGDSTDPVQQALRLLLDVGTQIRVSARTLTPRDKRQERTLRPLGDRLPAILRALLKSGYVETTNISAHGSTVTAIRSAAGIPRLQSAIKAGEKSALQARAELQSILKN